MSRISRRNFLRNSTIGLATLGTGVLILRPEAQPTPSSGPLPEGLIPEGLIPEGAAPKGLAPKASLVPTEPNILGPFFRSNAPFRGKITPPLAPGVVMVIRGRVWSFETKKPLPNTVLDIWQANSAGRYDNDNPSKPPAPGVFHNRARLVTDESGFYEFETVHPGKYPLDETRLRPAHIHYRISHGAHKTLVTQLYFQGDPSIEGDPFVRPSLIITLKQQKVGAATYETGVFDIVLEAK